MQNWVYKPRLKLAVEDARRASRESHGAPAAATRPPAFLPVRLEEIAAGPPKPHTRSAIEVLLGQGRRILVGPGLDPETLRRVVAVLEG
jgi:hypothetical protein